MQVDEPDEWVEEPTIDPVIGLLDELRLSNDDNIDVHVGAWSK